VLGAHSTFVGAEHGSVPPQWPQPGGGTWQASRSGWFARGCKRCAALGMHDLPVDDEAHLLFSCPATAVVRQERRFAQLPFTSLQDLMCCRDVYRAALFVHKCMKIADAAAGAAARQQPRLG
jgi:hypothetical protein